MIDFEWVDTPIHVGSNTSAYTRSAWIYGEPVETFDTHGLAMIDFNTEFQRADLAVCVDGVWYSSSTTEDWPTLGKIFGAGWMMFLSEYEQECLEDLEGN